MSCYDEANHIFNDCKVKKSKGENWLGEMIAFVIIFFLFWVLTGLVLKDWKVGFVVGVVVACIFEVNSLSFQNCQELKSHFLPVLTNQDKCGHKVAVEASVATEDESRTTLSHCNEGKDPASVAISNDELRKVLYEELLIPMMDDCGVCGHDAEEHLSGRCEFMKCKCSVGTKLRSVQE